MKMWEPRQPNGENKNIEEEGEVRDWLVVEGG